MITTTCLDSKTKKFVKDFPAAELSDYCGSEKNVVWADVSDPTSEDSSNSPRSLTFTRSPSRTAATRTSAQD